MILGKDNVERLPPPVGTSDWATFSRDSYCVDKTLLIKELIDTKMRVALFTRPRRFGKTTAMRMIRAFYEGDASLFEDKLIWASIGTSVTVDALYTSPGTDRADGFVRTGFPSDAVVSTDGRKVTFTVTAPVSAVILHENAPVPGTLLFLR